MPDRVTDLRHGWRGRVTGMNDEKADGADLERVLRDIATDRSTTTRDRVLAAASLKILKHSASLEGEKAGEVAELWRYHDSK